MRASKGHVEKHCVKGCTEVCAGEVTNVWIPCHPRVLQPSGACRLREAAYRKANTDFFDRRGWVFGWLHTPEYVPLYGNGLADISTIELSYSPDNIYQPPPEIANLFNRHLQRLKSTADEEDRRFTPGPVVRLLQHEAAPSPPGALRLKTGAANYHQYAVIGDLLQRDAAGQLVDDNGQMLSLREKYSVHFTRFDSQIVCGALGVEVTVVTRDQKFVAVTRSRAVASLQTLLVVTLGEGMHPVRDRREAGDGETLLDPFAASARGAKEELGIDIAPDTVTFLALGVHKTTMDPDLLGMVQVPYTASEIAGSMRDGLPRDRWESVGLEFHDFNPAPVARFLGTHSIHTLTPAAPMCLVFSLLRCFTEREVTREFLNHKR